MTTQLREANPYTDEQIDALALHGEEAMREAILRHRRRSPRPRWQWAGLTAGMVATAATLAIVFVGGSAPERAWSAEAVRVAESVPRLLLPGWSVNRADEFSVDEGEMSFEKDGRVLELRWSSGGHRRLVKDRANSSDRLPDATVAGETAIVFKYRDTPNDDFTSIWRKDGYVLELRTGFTLDGASWMNAEEYRAALTAFREADVDAWLSAMPESVVLPVDSERVVAEMLEGVPVPEGFDPSKLADSGVRDRYQLGAKVAGGVACAWIARYYEGDRAEAAAALATVRDWKVLHEMKAEGAYPEVLWETVDAVTGDGFMLGGKTYPIRDNYKEGLGC